MARMLQLAQTQSELHRGIKTSYPWEFSNLQTRFPKFASIEQKFLCLSYG